MHAATYIFSAKYPPTFFSTLVWLSGTNGRNCLYIVLVAWYRIATIRWRQSLALRLISIYCFHAQFKFQYTYLPIGENYTREYHIQWDSLIIWKVHSCHWHTVHCTKSEPMSVTPMRGCSRNSKSWRSARGQCLAPQDCTIPMKQFHYTCSIGLESTQESTGTVCGSVQYSIDSDWNQILVIPSAICRPLLPT
jgi:hypothetical protein